MLVSVCLSKARDDTLFSQVSELCEVRVRVDSHGAKEIEPPRPIPVFDFVSAGLNPGGKVSICSHQKIREEISAGSGEHSKFVGTCSGYLEWTNWVSCSSDIAWSRDARSATLFFLPSHHWLCRQRLFASTVDARYRASPLCGILSVSVKLDFINQPQAEVESPILKKQSPGRVLPS